MEGVVLFIAEEEVDWSGSLQTREGRFGQEGKAQEELDWP